MSSLLRCCVAGAVIGLAGIAATGCDNKEKASGPAETVDVSKALPADKVTTLLAGNTLELHQISRDVTVRRFYAKDGTFTASLLAGEPGAQKGRWRVSDKGQKCVTPSQDKPERCFYVVGNEQQGYVMASEDGKVTWKITAVVAGNPDKR